MGGGGIVNAAYAALAAHARGGHIVILRAVSDDSFDPQDGDLGKMFMTTWVFGIGVDEKTALLVGADGIGRLAEGSAGSAWIVTPRRPAAILVKGQPLTMKDFAPAQDALTSPMMMRSVVPPDEG